MGCRAHIVNLESKKKVYSHWGAAAFEKANSFEELKEIVQELYDQASDHRPPEEEGIEGFTDEDAVEDIDLHIERIFVLGNEEFRGYTRTMLHDTGDGVSDDMVVFKFSDRHTFWDARHISLRLKHYNEAYMKQNIEEHKSEALEQALRNRRAQVENDVDIIYSTIPPRKYDLAIKQVVKDWHGKDENPPEVVTVSGLLEQQGVR